MQPIDTAYLSVFFIMIYSSVLWFIVFFRNKNDFPVTAGSPSITFLVPAFNEEKNIGRCIDSLLSMDYGGEVKIVVINDGSTDRTGEIAKQYAGKVTVLEKPNEGKKSKALNYALGKLPVSTELTACMDADSYVSKDYLKRIVEHMGNADAVTPAMKVSEPRTIYQMVQWVEYCFAIFLRRVFSVFECQYVLPGPGSIYRTASLKKAGYFDENNLTEDMELAFRMHDNGQKIGNCVNAFVYTECPDTFRKLLKQRVRWYRGYLQNVFKYRHMILNPSYGNLGIYLIPVNFIWIFVLLFLFIYPIFNIASQIWDFSIRWSSIGFALTQPKFNIGLVYLDFYIVFWALFWVLNIMTVYLSITASGEKVDLKARKKYYIGYVLMYPVMLTIFWIAALWDEISKARLRW
ncbi:MAG: glycosyltransferase family 2 protein [Candidatus Aenigmarchaeota archaeon]|nr:glycosyltransferase family 2 protein [Candidatus Aenigmarchaeota archaeon]